MTRHATAIRDMMAPAFAANLKPDVVNDEQWFIVRKRAEGWSEEAIAHEMNLSPERVQLEERMAMNALYRKAVNILEVTQSR